MKVLRVTFFVTTYLVLLAAAPLLAGLLWRSRSECRILKAILKSARAETARYLREAEHFRMACDNASDGILIQDMRARIIWANPAYCRIHGRSLRDIVGRNPLEFALSEKDTPPKDVIDAFRYDVNDPRHKQLQLFRNRHSNGRFFWNQVSVSFRRSTAGEERAILVCRDVTDQIEQETRLRETRNRLQKEATHDSLTGLPNRAAFQKFIQSALETRHCIGVGLLHVDLDEFKGINDTHGHSAGDAVLLHTANALRENIRKHDLVARVGGDEFVVVCPEMQSLKDLEKMGQTLLHEIAKPLIWNDLNLSCKASIGAALSTKDNTDHNDLLVRSDFAMYEAKKAGRNRIRVYNGALYRQHRHENRRSAELSEAIDTGSMDHFYQPTLCMKTGKVTGLETLVRWNHPKDGMLPPVDFLPMAERMGLMGALDLWSMSAALQQKRHLNQNGFTDICIAFNASPQLLAHPEFINRLVFGVEAGSIDRAQITIEVLETTAFGDVTENSSHAAVIRDLRAAGFNVLLDDFGVGFAGLSHLARLDVTGVKIDRSLIKDILTDETSHKIVRKIIELSNDLGLNVVSEGVEDAKTAEAVSAMGCDIIQGYWIAKPLPASQ
ncbi:MAG: EAL domain-containing protein, partial [Octadecabacter sp.]|nr:EAL domain-containing protein [Octadecabacter sp.]